LDAVKIRARSYTVSVALLLMFGGSVLGWWCR